MIPDRAARQALTIAGIYLVIGVLWILFSDRTLEAMVSDPALLSRAQTWKGIAFVGATAMLLYLLSRHALRAQASVHEQERLATRRVRLLTEYAPVGIYYALPDGRVTFVNPNLAAMTGLPAEQTCEYGWLDITHPGDRERVQTSWNNAVSAGEEYFLTYRLVGKDGNQRWVSEHAVPERDAGGNILGYVGTVTDVTRHVELEQRQRINAAALGDTFDGILVVDREFRIISANRALTQATGYAEEELMGRTPDIFDSGRQDADFFRAQREALLANGNWCGEVWNRRRNGEVYATWLAISAVRNDRQEAAHFVYVYTDISKLKESEERLRNLAHFDQLTGIPNRLLMHMRLEHAIRQAQRRNDHVAVLFIDLDDFKIVNDRFGHATGDELLAKVARRLRSRVRGEDTLARYGGDEFIVLLESMERRDEAATVARALLGALSAPFTVTGGHEVHVHCSIGISVYPEDGQDLEALVRAADAAMYRAKEGGGDRFGFYSDPVSRTMAPR